MNNINEHLSYMEQMADSTLPSRKISEWKNKKFTTAKEIEYALKPYVSI